MISGSERQRSARSLALSREMEPPLAETDADISFASSAGVLSGNSTTAPEFATACASFLFLSEMTLHFAFPSYLVFTSKPVTLKITTVCEGTSLRASMTLLMTSSRCSSQLKSLMSIQLYSDIIGIISMMSRSSEGSRVFPGRRLRANSSLSPTAAVIILRVSFSTPLTSAP